MRRRGLLIAACGAAALPALAATVLVTPTSLESAARLAQLKRRALVLLFSTPGCPWCKLVRESYLAPLVAEGQPVFEIDMSGSGAIVDFDGSPTTEARVASRLGVVIAPTVLFLGPRGQPLAPALRGVSSEDFYGAYLQQRGDAANRAAG